PYIVMELYPVPSLKMMLTLKSPAELATLMDKILMESCTALNYMHQQGWIHCDIKPDNFLSDDKGNVKMIDFALSDKPKTGLAKLFGGKSKVQGTRSYISPEQIRGKPAEFRSDIYSLGCMMHEMFSGKPPFVGTNSNELLQRHLKSQAQSLESIDANLTPEISLLVRRMLSKKPEDRPESMKQVIVTLRSLRFYRRTPHLRRNLLFSSRVPVHSRSMVLVRGLVRGGWRMDLSAEFGASGLGGLEATRHNLSGCLALPGRIKFPATAKTALESSLPSEIV
ncbi:MAG: serine/threonine protein kinase, partial [Planctomycetales bacterium]